MLEVAVHTRRLARRRTTRGEARALAVLLGLSLAACLGTGTRRIDAPCREMSATVVREMLRDNTGIPVLDVRRPEEVTSEQGRIRNGIEVPLERLAARIPKLARFKKTTVVVMGRDRAASERACSILNAHGFEWVIFVSGGAAGWFQGGYSDGQGAAEAPPSR